MNIKPPTVFPQRGVNRGSLNARSWQTNTILERCHAVYLNLESTLKKRSNTKENDRKGNIELLVIAQSGRRLVT